MTLRTVARAFALSAVVLSVLPAVAAAQGRMVQDPIAEIRLAPRIMVEGAFPWREAAPDRLLVIDQARSAALVVDPVSFDVVARLPTGPAPHEVAVSPDGRLAYVSHGYGPTGPEDGGSHGTLTVLDLEELRVRATFQPRAFRALNAIGMNESGSRLFITAEADSAILELDARDGSLLMLWRTAGAQSRALATSRDGRKLYVASAGSDSVAVIDRRTVVGHRVPTGTHPYGLDLSPDGQELWVANRDDHTITVVDATREWPVASFISGGEEPVRVRFRPDGREAWVAHLGSRTVAVFDVAERRKVGEIPLPGAPLAILFSPDGRRAFVALPEWGEVAVVDVSAREVVEWIPAGKPGGLAWSRRSEAGAPEF